MSAQRMPIDIQEIVNQTIESLRGLVPPSPSSIADEIKDAIIESIESLDKDLRTLNLAIHDNPELAFKEVKAHANMVAALTKLGFTVTNPSSISTAFLATYTHGKGGRTFGFDSEYDALQGVGHACGHNLIAVIGVAAAAGLKACMKACNISGTIQLIGSPAEEGGGGKVILLREGAYADMDACAMAHPGGGYGPTPWDGDCPTEGPASLARASFEIEFFGKGAHAGAAPWMGINALDAAVQGYNAISMLRQQLEPTMRVHGIIQGSEQWAPNIIPSYAKVSYNVRAMSIHDTLALRKKAIACFESAATATGCTYKVTAEENELYADLRNNVPMSDTYASLMTKEFGDKINMTGMTTASTDFGNVCYALPSISPNFLIPAPDGSINHTVGFTEAAGKPEAHRLAMKVAKGLAMVGAKFLTDDKFAKEVREDYEKFKKSIPEDFEVL